MRLAGFAGPILIAAALFLPACSRNTKSQKPSEQKSGSISFTNSKSIAPEKTSLAAPAWKTVEEVTYNWNGRGSVKFIAEIHDPTEYPGDFRRIRIQVPGEKEFVLDNADGWVAFDSANSPFRHWEPTKALVKRSQTRLNSRYFMFVDIAPRRSVLLLPSWEYASDPSRLHVFDLPPIGPPKLVFNDLFEVVDLADLDRDGKAELVGLPCLSQVWGPEDGSVTTYDPIRVLRFDLKREHLEPALELSKTYNEVHRGFWAGPDCSEQLAVYTPKHGKPRVITSKEVEDIGNQSSH